MDKAQIDMLHQLLVDRGDEIEQLERLLTFEGQMKPRIVVYGTYNSGKSSLLNALTGHYESSFFRVNDIPETREENVYESEHFFYVDTPGLDVNTEDDRIALRGIAGAVLVLIVHRLAAGSLQEKDLNVFQRIMDTNNVMVVLTGAEQPEEDAALIDEITAMINRGSPKTIPVFPVSNPRYLKGKREGKLKLVAASGIPALIMQLEQCGDELRAALKKDRKTRRERLLSSLLHAAVSLQSSKQAALTRKRRVIENQQQQFVAGVQELKRELKEKITEYNKLV
ncbi:50S ribosome-binding GTPase [Citrobacter sp. Awk 4]|uniref:GTPase domain-containing protein n=1 Tax=Citrobacter sp. Awk 4 TaxID=2963955 RepID=UPI002304B1AB|nr:GTPase [Citrobacter sp. Awk 4]MDA8481193.1 50S ribosome-binding GTPase [Citrobacter sp. Awk 4]